MRAAREGLVDDEALARTLRSDVKRRPAWALWLEHHVSVAGTERRAAVTRRAASDVASAIPLTAAVYVATGSVIVGAAVAAFDLALRPVICAHASRAVKRWRSRREDLHTDGDGI